MSKTDLSFVVIRYSVKIKKFEIVNSEENLFGFFKK
jgi:hypothetical protein